MRFHPERLRKPGGSGDEFDYPGCARAYQEFVRAVVAYQEKTAAGPHLPRGAPVPAPPKLSKEMERRRKVISRSFSLAKDMYLSGGRTNPAEQRDLEAGAEFLEVISLKFACARTRQSQVRTVRVANTADTCVDVRACSRTRRR